MVIFNVPWMCIGDFNDVREVLEKDGGRVKAKRKVIVFRSL